MAKKMLLFVGVLCWILPLLAPGIGGIDFDRATFLALFIVGTIAIVGAAILHQLEKRSP